MIEITNLTLVLGKKVILKQINVHFEKGQIHGLIGRNGSGKTMLMKCVCGFARATEGTVRVGGAIIGKDCDFPENTGVIIEVPTFIPYYSGFKNLKILASLNKKISNDEIKRVLCEVGLNPNDKLHVGKYSLGMRQRLGLAQAIMEDPELIILDEPMNGLDKEGVADVRRYLLELKKRGKTILLASHSAEDISILCDTVHEMEHGSLKRYS